jgi:hypothetical protein
MLNNKTMPRKLYTLLFIATAMLAACKKDLSTGDKDFEVTAVKPTLTLGDTARFNVSGNPDMITFYSGEPGKRFEYKDRATADGTPTLSFSTIRANGSQPNSLQLMISTDFKGVAKGDTVATKANITAATWTDITARAKLSTGATAAVASGNIDLSDYAAAGKPIFIAFKYNGVAGSAQSKWTVSAFSVKNVLADGTSYEIANMNTSTTPYTVYGVTTFSPGFAAYTLQNIYTWSVGTTLVITGATPASNAKAPSEAWAFVGPINLKKVVPDVGVLIKSPTQNISGVPFTYKYESKGTFNAVFIGGSLDINQTSFVQKPLKITIN